MPYLEGPPPAPEHPDKALHHNVDSVLLNLAEAAAFGDGAGCDPAYHRFYDGIYDTHGLTAQLRAVEKQFWQFIRANRCLYHGYHTHADIGIVFHDVRSAGNCTGQEYVELTDLAKDLAGHSVLWDVLTENRCNTANFARVRALVYQDVSRLSEAEREAVQVYLEQGGLVIAAKIVGDEDEWFRMRLPDAQRAWPPVDGLPQGQGGARERPAPFRQQVGAGLLIYQPGPLDAETVLAAVEAHIGRTAQCAGNVPREVQERLRLNAWMRPGDGGSLVLHVVNYNVPLGTDQGGQVQPLEQVQVRVPLPSGTHVQEIMLYSPETDIFSDSEVEFDVIGDSLISFTIPRMRIYTVAEIALSPSAGSLH
jgi:hypothetical protein